MISVYPRIIRMIVIHGFWVISKSDLRLLRIIVTDGFGVFKIDIILVRMTVTNEFWFSNSQLQVILDHLFCLFCLFSSIYEDRL